MMDVTIDRQQTTIARVEVITLANAATLVGIAAYVLCSVVAALAPGLYLAFFQSWFHGISLTQLLVGAAPLSFGTFVTGLVTFAASVWIVIAATAALYNRLAR